MLENQDKGYRCIGSGNHHLNMSLAQFPPFESMLAVDNQSLSCHAEMARLTAHAGSVAGRFVGLIDDVTVLTMVAVEATIPTTSIMKILS